MEDTGKRLLLAVALCGVIMAAFTMLGPKPRPRPQAAPPAAVAADAGAGATAAAQPVANGDAGPGVAQPAGGTAAGATPVAPKVTSCDAKAAKSETVMTDKYVATFSECGGALMSWRLTGGQYRKKDAQGVPQPIDLVALTSDAAFFPLQVSFPESTVAVDPGARWSLVKKGASELEATYRDERIEVSKLYTASADSYAMDLKITIKNLSSGDIEQRLAVQSFGYQDPSTHTSGGFMGVGYRTPVFQAACYVNGGVKRDMASKLGDEPKVRAGDVRWVGIDHKFFLFALAPRGTDEEARSCEVRGFGQHAGVMEATVRFPAYKLAAGARADRQLTIYAGPKLYDALEDVSAQGDLRLQKSVYLGWFPWLTRPLLSLLKIFHGFVGNWGVAIILLTLTVKLATLYWTLKSSRSMKAMSKLKPKMDEIRKKYENDKNRMNIEIMNLYKTHGVNPLAGCLPMLLQMPVWIALYSALNAAAELYQAPFVGWLRDLTSPDPYYIIPVLATGLVFLQQKMTPTTVDSSQQRMMMIMMPLIFGTFSLFFPSGLTVYILTNTALSLLQQVYINRDGQNAAPAVAQAGGGKRPAKA